MMSKKEVFSEDPEMNEFCHDLLESIAQMRAGQAAKVHHVQISWVTAIRNKTGLTQKEFAKLLGVSVRTLQSWEQGVRSPSGAASTVLKIADKNPKLLSEIALA